MKIQTMDQSLVLIPEHNFDCYLLGKISSAVRGSRVRTTSPLSDSDPSIEKLEIPFHALQQVLINVALGEEQS